MTRSWLCAPFFFYFAKHHQSQRWRNRNFTTGFRLTRICSFRLLIGQTLRHSIAKSLMFVNMKNYRVLMFRANPVFFYLGCFVVTTVWCDEWMCFLYVRKIQEEITGICWYIYPWIVLSRTVPLAKSRSPVWFSIIMIYCDTIGNVCKKQVHCGKIHAINSREDISALWIWKVFPMNLKAFIFINS